MVIDSDDPQTPLVAVCRGCGGAGEPRRSRGCWAQLVERLADRWGRDLRYGGQPHEPEAEVTPGLTRAALFAQVLGLTDLLDRVERMEIDPTVDAGSVAIEPGALEAELERLSRLPIER